MEKLNAVIVEDVISNPVLVQNLLRTCCQEVNIAAVAENVKDAVKVIGEIAPQVVFCDIELPDGSGFDILEHFIPLPFKVIFISGKREHAYRAIKYHPVDFILRPIRIDELIYAVNAVTSTGKDEKARTRIENVNPQVSYPNKIALMDSTGGYVVVEPGEIIKLEANGNDTDIYLVGNRKLTYSRLLKEFADLLESHLEFIRTHRSYLVNITHVKSCSKQGIIKLSEDHTAHLGDSYRKEFLSCFKNN